MSEDHENVSIDGCIMIHIEAHAPRLYNHDMKISNRIIVGL